MRRWRVGGCRYCPRWGEVGELWRTLAERRRAGGFRVLAPSTDPEWRDLATRSDRARAGAVLAARQGGLDGVATETLRRPAIHELIGEWLALEPRSAGGGGTASTSCSDGASEECLTAKWEAMLCDASASHQEEMIDWQGFDAI